ncbi:MAG: hypothetical protein GF329_17810 [Candidatus Lokiarchaeota archaeon]|nr:hypothetical protein [Candidatus Lokiarchaeota archaeon]
MEKFPSRSPALKKNIAEITDEDTRVQVLGTVLDYKQGIVGDTTSLSQVIISDGSDDIKIFIDEYWDKKFKIKERIRVFGTISMDENGEIGLNAEIIQDMNDLDMDLYNKVKEIRNRQ